jgi:hypothetical protein
MLQGFAIRACGISIAILCDDSLVLETLNRFLLPWAPRTSDSQTSEVFSIEPSGASGRFSIRRRDELIAAAEEPQHLFTALQRAVDDAIVEHLSGFCVIHAGVAAIGDSIVLLPGSSGSGKTTLVAELVRRGAEYYSDEYALVDECGRVHPYPRALMLRDAEGIQHPILPQDLNARVGAEPKPVARVLLLQVQPDSSHGLNLQRLNQSEGMLRLLQHTPQTLDRKPGILKPIGALAASAAFFTGTRGEVAGAAEEILRMAEPAV